MEAFRRCSIAVVPSVWAEPFGIVVIEAMAGKSAVVASDIGGIPEIVRNGVSGLLVPPGDSVALRGALADLIAVPVADSLASVQEEIIQHRGPISWTMIDGQILT